MNAYEYLEQVKKADAMIEDKRAEERELWALATSMGGNLDGMPRGTDVSDKVGNIVQKIIDAQERTNAQIDRFIGIREDVIHHVEMLPPKQCRVLKWLYIMKREQRKKNQSWYYTWQEVAEILGCTEQNISNLRKRAVRNLQKILDNEAKVD